MRVGWTGEFYGHRPNKKAETAEEPCKDSPAALGNRAREILLRIKNVAEIRRGVPVEKDCDVRVSQQE